MAVTTDSPEVHINLAEDASEARLVVPATFDRARLTVEGCLGLLESAGVAIGEAVREAVQHAINEARRVPQGRRFECVLATAQQPVHGEDGWLEWFVDQPRTTAATEEEDDPEAGIDYYAQSPFTLVATGDVLGQVHPPTAGQAGCDVTGAPIETSDGSPVEVQLDETIEQRDDGMLVAQIGGVLVRHGNQAAIHSALEIDGDVDFSTGHITFDGDVVVKGGVRDRFRIESTGNVEVHGLIEAATLDIEGNLHAKGGFAGREQGNARIKGDLYARYLDSIRGTVQGSLIVEREIIGCDMTVHGDVRAESGAIIGGKLNATGIVHAALLGSRAGTPTQLIVGRVPRLEPLAEKLSKRIHQITARHNALGKQLKQTAAQLAQSQDTAGARHHRSMEAELETLKQTRAKAADALTHLRAAIDRQRTVIVDIEKRLSPGVVIVVGYQHFHIQDELRGPLYIRCDKTGQVVVQRRGGQTMPLATVAELEAE